MGLIPSSGDEQGVMLVSVSTVFLGLAVVAVAMRFWSSHLRKRSLNPNDYLILLALTFSAALVAIIVTATVKGGLGQHTSSIINHPQKLVVFGKTFVAIQPFWVSAITAVKVSILDLYTDIFRPNKRFRKFCFAGMAACSFFWLYDILVAFLICQPLAFNWDQTIPGGHCGNEVAAYIAAHTINFVLDVSLAILPMPVLWGLQMPTRKKVEISIMFSLGTLICVISVLRIAFWRDLKGNDLTYTVVFLYLCTALEPLLGIVLASLPVIRPAGAQIMNSSILTWVSPGRWKRSSSSSHMASKSSEARDFERLPEDSDLAALKKDPERHPLEDL